MATAALWNTTRIALVPRLLSLAFLTADQLLQRRGGAHPTSASVFLTHPSTPVSGQLLAQSR